MRHEGRGAQARAPLFEGFSLNELIQLARVSEDMDPRPAGTLRVFVLTNSDFRSLLDERPSIEPKVLRTPGRRVVEQPKDPTVA